MSEQLPEATSDIHFMDIVTSFDIENPDTGNATNAVLEVLEFQRQFTSASALQEQPVPCGMERDPLIQAVFLENTQTYGESTEEWLKEDSVFKQLVDQRRFNGGNPQLEAAIRSRRTFLMLDWFLSELESNSFSS